MVHAIGMQPRRRKTGFEQLRGWLKLMVLRAIYSDQRHRKYGMLEVGPGVSSCFLLNTRIISAVDYVTRLFLFIIEPYPGRPNGRQIVTRFTPNLCQIYSDGF